MAEAKTDTDARAPLRDNGRMTTFLGVDVGTQGLKAILLDPVDGPVATASQSLETLPGLAPGFSEQRPEDWIDALRRAIADLHVSAPRAMAKLRAIGVSGQQHGLVALDAWERVIRPAMLWNDVRCAVECDEIIAAVGGTESCFRRTGLAALPPGFTAGKIRWLWRHEPENYARLEHVLLPHDYVNLWLCGERSAEAGDASGTGLLDVRRRDYDDALCEATAPDLRSRLSPIRAPGGAAGRLRDEVADELHLPRGTIVALGGGDNMMAAIGAGAVESGTAVMSLGTSGTIFAFADRPICDPGGEIAPFCDSAGGWLPLGCTMNATVATETTRALFGLQLPAFEAAVAAALPGSGGVTCLPFFTGERSPNLPHATGSFVGITPRNATPGNLARAAMEGATFALARLLDRLATLGLPLRELRLTGGGSRSPSWRAIVAAACGLPVTEGVHPDAAALGAAIQAAWTWRREVGETDLLIADCRRSFDLDRTLTRVEPDPDARAAYGAVRAGWNRALDALTPTYTPTLP